MKFLKATLPQISYCMRAAHAMMAVNHGLSIAKFLQLTDARREFAQGNMEGFRQRHELMLVRLTDVEQSEIIAGRKTFG